MKLLNCRYNLIHQISAFFLLTCVLVQILALTIILIFKIKHHLKERRHQYSNAAKRISPNTGLGYSSSTALDMNNRKKPWTVFPLNNRIEPNDVLSTPEISKFNTTAYNKILVELYQITFYTITMTIALVATSVKKGLDSHKIEAYSKFGLYFLDLTPRILLSIVLPSSIHFNNPEIRRYIKRLFKNTRN